MILIVVSVKLSDDTMYICECVIVCIWHWRSWQHLQTANDMFVEPTHVNNIVAQTLWMMRKFTTQKGTGYMYSIQLFVVVFSSEKYQMICRLLVKFIRLHGIWHVIGTDYDIVYHFVRKGIWYMVGMLCAWYAKRNCYKITDIYHIWMIK